MSAISHSQRPLGTIVSTEDEASFPFHKKISSLFFPERKKNSYKHPLIQSALHPILASYTLCLKKAKNIRITTDADDDDDTGTMNGLRAQYFPSIGSPGAASRRLDLLFSHFIVVVVVAVAVVSNGAKCHYRHPLHSLTRLREAWLLLRTILTGGKP